jgi:hypothetical protein
MGSIRPVDFFHQALTSECDVEKAQQKMRYLATHVFKQRAFESQSKLSHDSFLELDLPITQPERLAIEKHYQKEIAEANVEYRTARSNGISHQHAYRSRLARIECANDLRRTDLSRTRKDNCRNWDGSKERLDIVLNHVCDKLSTETMEEMLEPFRQAKQQLSHANVLRGEGKDLEAQSIEDQVEAFADSWPQVFLSRIRRFQLLLTSGKPINSTSKRKKKNAVIVGLEQA